MPRLISIGEVLNLVQDDGAVAGVGGRRTLWVFDVGCHVAEGMLLAMTVDRCGLSL